jgi:magnesium transporter
MKNKQRKTLKTPAKHRRTKHALGNAPGTIRYVGSREVEQQIIRVTDYKENYHSVQEVKAVEQVFQYKDTDTVTLIDIQGLNQEEEIEKLGKHFQINPLVLEDLVNTSQRPKVDEYEDYIFCVFKSVTLSEANRVVIEHVAIILFQDSVLLFQEVENTVFDGVRRRISNEYGRIRYKKCDYLYFALIDSIIDQYFVVLEEITDHIEHLEDQVYNYPKSAIVNEIQDLRKEIIDLRKNVLPVREISARLVNTEHKLIGEDTKLYLGDVHDHSVQIHETLEMLREMSMSLMEMYMSTVTVKMNEIMKVLTIMTSIFIPLTFITGVYGMNFQYLPGLHSEFGFYAAMGIMFLILVTLIVYFKSKRWI